MKRKTDIRVHTRVLYIRIFSSYATARQAKTHRVTAKTKRDWLWSNSDERQREKKKRHGVSPLRMSVRAWSAMERSTPDEPLPPPLFPHRNTRVIKSFHERNDP